MIELEFSKTNFWLDFSIKLLDKFRKGTYSDVDQTPRDGNRVVDWAKLTRFLEALIVQNIGMSSPVSIKTISVIGSIRMLIKLKEKKFRVVDWAKLRSFFAALGFRNI